MATKDELRIVTFLRSVPFAQGMDPKHIKKLASLAAEVKFAPNEIIFHEGDEGRAIFFIEEGQVVVEAQVAGRGQVPMLNLGPNELLGWSSLFPPRRKTYSARAAAPTWAIAIDVDRLQEAFQADHSLEFEVIRRIADVIGERLKATRQHLLNNL
jgi:CRP-like cAMP-binding protein